MSARRKSYSRYKSYGRDKKYVPAPLAPEPKMKSLVKQAILFSKVKRWAKSVRSTSLSWYIDLDVTEIKEDTEAQKNSSVDEEIDEHTRARLDLIERNKRLAAEKRRAELRRRKLFAQSQRSTREANKMILAFKAKERRKLRALQRKRQRLEEMQNAKAKNKNPYYKLA